jgi:ethanolamine ammonia-lyase small subunit
MKKLLLLASLSLFGVACGGGDVDKLKKLKDEACACKDKACADAVNKKMDSTMEGMKEPSADDAKKLMEIMTEAAVCLQKAGASADGK